MSGKGHLGQSSALTELIHYRRQRGLCTQIPLLDTYLIILVKVVEFDIQWT